MVEPTLKKGEYDISTMNEEQLMDVGKSDLVKYIKRLRPKSVLK